MKIVRIQALPREGYAFRPRAGRFFPASEPVAVEIVDAEEDPTIEVDKTDSAGKTYKQKVPDPKRMSKTVFDTMIMPDPVLRVLADGETISFLSQAALDAARKQASDMAGDLVGTKAALADAKATIAKLEAQVADLKAAAEAKAGDPGAKSVEGGEPPADKGGKASKGK